MTDANELNEIRLYDSFDNLFAGQSSSGLSPDELVRHAFEKGRILLQAPAGAGKSTLLRRIADQAEGDITTTSLRLLDADDVPAAMEALDAETLLRGTRRLVLVDGLDQLPLSGIEAVLRQCERVTASDPDLAVIVADRPGRRDIRSHRWGLVELATSADSAASGLAAESLRLAHALETTQGSKRPTLDSIVGQLVDLRTRRRLQRLATTMWSKDIKVVNRLTARQSLGPAAFRSAVDSGVMIEAEEGGFSFAHHLLHAHLVALDLHDSGVRWSASMLDFLTKDGRIDSVLSSYFDLLSDEETDNFVLAVDSWNFYAAASLAADDFRRDRRIGSPFRAVLLLTLGLRMLGRSLTTASKCRDWLMRHGGSLSAAILEVHSRDDLARVAAQVEFPPSTWMTRWFDTYCTSSGMTVTPEQVQQIKSTNSILGWTAANVMQHLHVDDSTLETLVEIASGAGAARAVRWRALHALGGTAAPETLTECLKILKEPDWEWLLTGAVRTYFMVAANLPSTEARDDAVARLADSVPAELASTRLRSEVQRAVQLRNPPPNWPSTVGLVVEQLWARASSASEQDQWRRLSAELRSQARSSDESSAGAP